MATAAIPVEASADEASVLDDRPVTTHLDASANGMAMSVAEFDAVETWDESYRFELIHGVVVMSPAPLIGERFPNGYLEYVLRLYRKTDAGKAVGVLTVSEHDLRLPTGIRRADRVIWCGLGRKPDFRNDLPTIAIEFVSRTTRDRRRDFVEKRREYLTAGVREYWIVDRFRRTVTVCTTPEGKEGRRTVKEKATYHTDLLPGFTLDVGELMAEADEVSGED